MILRICMLIFIVLGFVTCWVIDYREAKQENN